MSSSCPATRFDRLIRLWRRGISIIPDPIVQFMKESEPVARMPLLNATTLWILFDLLRPKDYLCLECMTPPIRRLLR